LCYLYVYWGEVKVLFGGCAQTELNQPLCSSLRNAHGVPALIPVPMVYVYSTDTLSSTGYHRDGLDMEDMQHGLHVHLT
jgi:hypothetical protein